MDYVVNANRYVKVKLTKYGISILKGQHDEMNRLMLRVGGKGLGDFKLRLDKDGYYVTQIWALMNTFGAHLTASSENPFELELIFVGGSPVVAGGV